MCRQLSHRVAIGPVQANNSPAFGLGIGDQLRTVCHAAATAVNILAHEQLFWLGFALSLIAVAFHLGWAFLFYDLFKPVNRSISILALCVILVGCAMQALTSLPMLSS